MNYFIIKSKRKNKKYDLLDKDKNYILSFGHTDYQDYTTHKDEERKKRYIKRHENSPGQNHNKSGVETAGFMSRWILWNKPTITASIQDTNKRFNINIQTL